MDSLTIFIANNLGCDEQRRIFHKQQTSSRLDDAQQTISFVRFEHNLLEDAFRHRRSNDTGIIQQGLIASRNDQKRRMLILIIAIIHSRSNGQQLTQSIRSEIGDFVDD